MPRFFFLTPDFTFAILRLLRLNFAGGQLRFAALLALGVSRTPVLPIWRRFLTFHSRAPDIFVRYFFLDRRFGTLAVGRCCLPSGGRHPQDQHRRYLTTRPSLLFVCVTTRWPPSHSLQSSPVDVIVSLARNEVPDQA